MIVDIRTLPNKDGICLTCGSNTDCPMIDMLTMHRRLTDELGESYMYAAPYLWDEYAIDEPDCSADGVVMWCPMYDSDAE